MITEEIKDKIQSILNVFETGSKEGDYSNISIFNDGPKNIKQITYGRSQTTEFGKLKTLLEAYSKTNGEFAKDFIPYIPKIGKQPSLCNDSTFKKLLKDAGADPVMHKTQDNFFDFSYWKPAHDWFIANKFTLPLSMLVIYDSYIHSGSIPMFLRKRFAASVPAVGGDEKQWITEYVNTRHNWLATHSTRPILRKTTYRTKCFIDQISNGNWDLNQSVSANGINI